MSVIPEEVRRRIEQKKKEAEQKRFLSQQRHAIEERKKRAQELLRIKQDKPQGFTNYINNNGPATSGGNATQSQQNTSVTSSAGVKLGVQGASYIGGRHQQNLASHTGTSNVSAGGTQPTLNLPTHQSSAKNTQHGASVSIEQRLSNYTYKPKNNSGPSKLTQPSYQPKPTQPSLQSSSPPKAAAGINSKNAKVKASCVLLSKTKFQVKIDHGFSQMLINVFKTMETRQYDPVSRLWAFHVKDYQSLLRKVSGLGGEVFLEGFPRWVTAAFRSQFSGSDATDRHIPDKDLVGSCIDAKLESSLLPFQRESVNFAISRDGKLLIADDMGLGKTLQALAIASYYRYEWPLLIVVPSSVRFAWREQIHEWLPSVSPQSVNVVVTGTENCTSGKINIVSYDLMVRKKKELEERGHKVVIFDESHLLKNNKTARCKAAIPLIQKARRVILLSGTPALSKPRELYSQIAAVDKKMFPSFHEFGLRYCEGKQNTFGWDYDGSSNLQELQLLLEDRIMIRRLKKDVISQLPSKTREMVVLCPNSIKQNKSMKDSDKLIQKLKGNDRRGAIFDYFNDTAGAKKDAVKDYVLEMVESGRKFLLFAHHKEMLDKVEETLVKKKIRFIRIDGRTSSELRNTYTEQFQTQDEIRVAVLSITSANAGLNLTAASLVIFAELFWNPGILIQAEDRCHRIGQQDSVNVKYLVAMGTADDYIWPLVQKKLEILSKAGLSKEDFRDAETKQLQDPKQKEILSYFEDSFIDESDLPEPDKEPSPGPSPSSSQEPDRAYQALQSTPPQPRPSPARPSPGKSSPGKSPRKRGITQIKGQSSIKIFMSPSKKAAQDSPPDRPAIPGEKQECTPGGSVLSVAEGEEIPDDWMDDLGVWETDLEAPDAKKFRT